MVVPTRRPCRLWPTRLLGQEGGFSRQEYWSVLANTGYHILLEHCISCCLAVNPPGTWCCQNPCNPSSCTASTPGPHRGKPKSSRAASGANPSGRPTCRGKTTSETQGQMAKEEDPKPSQQLYKLSSHNQLGRLCVCRIYKTSLRAPTKENALVLTAVDTGGKNTEE